MDKKRIMQNKKDVELDTNKLKKELQKLVADFKAVNGWQKGEQDIETSFTFELLKLLGWDKKDWIINTGQDVQTGNKPDIILKSDSSKLLVIESKEASKKDKLDGAYQSKTFTEQLFGYCEAEGLYWGVLTNFVEWRLYAVASKELYYGKKYAFYDLLWDNANKNNYIDLLSDDGLAFLKMLSKSDLAAKNGKIDINPIYYPKQLDLEQDKIKKEFFSKIKNWRAKLKTWITKNYTSQYNTDEIDLMAQKILDRMIFMDICHDKGVINENHIEAVLSATKRTYYDELKEKFKLMDEKFNTELFATHKIDNIKITNEVIAFIIKELNDIDFSKLSVHIIGEVYENYLGELAKSRTTDEKKISDKQKQKRKSQGIYYTPDYIVDYIVKNTVGELLSKVKTTAEIEKIRVLDPACGSGSFLIRAFDEFYNAYRRIHKVNIGQTMSDEFDIKRKILQNNIFGVDLDAKAVEIAKLNLMIKALDGIKPEDLKGTHLLPNLNLNIRCGNSLIGGEKLQEKELGLNLFDNYKTEIDKLADLKISFYKESDDQKKKDLLAEIGKLEEVINKNLNKGLGKYFPNLDKVNSFNYTVAFCEIFKDGGFDAVIGNPPYIRNRELPVKDKNFYNDSYFTALGQYDIYQLFFEKSIETIKDYGKLGFITSNKYAIAGYGKKLREFILAKCKILNIIDVSEIRVFKEASTYPYIIILQKDDNNKTNKIKVSKITEADSFEDIKYDQIGQGEYRDTDSMNFTIKKSPDFFKKIEKASDKLGEIAEIKETIHTGNIRNKLVVKEKINENCKELLAGKDCHRYWLKWNGLYINYDRNLVNRDKKEYANLVDKKYFENPKILLREIAYNIECVLDANKYYTLNKVYSVQLKNLINYKFALGLLNSKLLSFYFRNKFEEAHVGGNYLQFKKVYTSQLPIKKVESQEEKKIQNKIIDLVDEMLKLNKTLESREKNRTRIKAVGYEIDREVYKLYGLTEEEVKLIEGK